MTSSRKTDKDPVEQMQELQDLILGAEKERLHKLDRRVSDLESRTSDVAEVLPAAMDRLIADPAHQPDFERPVVNTIRNAIKRDTHSFAEALFPVLGPAIRRAVADALTGLVQRINIALENSFTVKGLKWRLEAARTGVPFPQIVLRHTMIYAVQEAFLIQRGSGLVLASVQRDNSLALDEDAVAAMLTAIQSFIQDSFGVSSDEPLRSAELGSRTLWVINGPVAVLACVISGTPPRSVRDELLDLLETLHARFGQRFREAPETLNGNEGLRALMNEALLEEADQEIRNSSQFKYKLLWLAGAIALVAFIAFSSVVKWQDNRFLESVEQVFESRPGYVVTQTVLDDRQVVLNGLRDPSTQDPAVLMQDSGLDAARVSTRFRPYQSLDTDIVVARLQDQLQLSPATRVALSGDQLVVDGEVTADQIALLQSLPRAHPSINDVSLEKARLAGPEAVLMLRAGLKAPDTVQFTPDVPVMRLSGNAHPEWIAQAQSARIDTLGWELDFAGLQQALRRQADEIVASLNQQIFLFRDGARLTPETESTLNASAESLRALQQIDELIQQDYSITLEGMGDGIGTREKNREVAMTRSRTVLQYLQERGVSADDIAITHGPWEEGGLSLDRRKVTLLIQQRNETP